MERIHPIGLRLHWNIFTLFKLVMQARSQRIVYAWSIRASTGSGVIDAPDRHPNQHRLP